MQKPNVSALAREHGVNQRTIRNWRDTEGLDLGDAAAVARRAAAMRQRQAGTDSISEARLAKLRAETERINHALAVERGQHVPAELMRKDGMRIGMVVGSAFTKLETDLPPQLAGRTAAEIQAVLHRAFRDARVELANYQSVIKFQ